MSDTSPRRPRSPGDGNPNGSGDPNFNWRGLVLLALALLLVSSAFLSPKLLGQSKTLTYKEFREKLNARPETLIDREKPFLFVLRPETGAEFIEAYVKNESGVSERFTASVQSQWMERGGFVEELKALKDKDGRDAPIIPQFETRPSVFSSGSMMLLSMLLMFGLIYFFFRQQIKMAGRGAMSFGKSKAKMLNSDRNKVTFKDVAGCDEAKEEVWELVEFLRDPKKFQRLGGKIPKGILMVGPPGTGKTLLAKGIAGEADVPFFSISGSDFVEMFVGVGASRVRDMFEQGRKSAPCLIFIDEIDAVGRHRGHGLGGGHDEREQTLNALLVEMDGFDTTEGVIIIAATNRPDVLDPALLRPGRFDRQVTVSLPDVKGREAILGVHAKHVKIAAEVNLNVIARGTPGYSGAELANVLNEAALLAARKGLKAITQAELEEARDKVRWGKERRSLALSEKEKENTAYHEAGHAILNELLEHTDPLHKVTIIPRGPALGVTMFLPEQDKFSLRKNELLDMLVVAMGGRVAEEIVFGDVTNGAVGDIRQATRIARHMVCEWGMSEKLGMVEYGSSDEPVFLARDFSSRHANYSGDTAQKIDEEVKRLIDEAYAKATAMLKERRSVLDAMAQALLEYETLDRGHVRELIEHGRVVNPPQTKPPMAPPPLPQTPSSEPPTPVRRDDRDGPLPGDLVPA
jgi:cell division protease FtsH